MNGHTLVERLRETKQTELDRLGSDKALLAATNADLETETVLGYVAATTAGLQEAFDDWAATSEGEASEVFARAASNTQATHDGIVADLDDVAVDRPAAVTVLDTFADSIEQVGGGLIGQGLVFDRTLLQVINFFINEADERRADQIRDVRTAANGRIEDGAVLLDELCQQERDWDRASATATQVIEAAYEEYVETLDEFGIDPKPVC